MTVTDTLVRMYYKNSNFNRRAASIVLFYHFGRSSDPRGGIPATHKRERTYGTVKSNLLDHIWHIIKIRVAI